MQHRFSLLLLILLLTSSALHAALPTQAPASCDFYRSRASEFPSGQASRADLEKGLLRRERNQFITALWNGKKYRFAEEELFVPLDTSAYAKNKISVEIFLAPSENSKTLRALSPAQKLRILEFSGIWTLVETPDNTRGWILRSHLEPINDDLGVFIPLIETSLRSAPNNNSNTLSLIPSGERLEALQFNNGFVLVSFQSKTGWIDLWHTIGRMDFAQFAYHEKHKWLEVSHRLHDQIVTKDGRSFPIHSIKGWHSHKDRALIRKPSVKTPPLRAQLIISEQSHEYWNLSKLDKHGEIWWKSNHPGIPPSSLALSSSNLIPRPFLLTDDLLKRDLYSIAFKSKESLAGLVSSQGVWRSLDGVNWFKISRFEDANLPVAIWPNGAWYVGSYKSVDQGKTFSPFIRWEKLTEAIEIGLGKSPRQIKITQIQPLSADQVELTVDIGGRPVLVTANIHLNNWKVKSLSR